MCQSETIATDAPTAQAGDAVDASVGRSLDMLQMKSICSLYSVILRPILACQRAVTSQRPCSAQYVPMYDAIVL